jgi:hypothetical protein
MTTPVEGDAGPWHRHFAIECNNRAWDLSVADRSAAEDREMLDVAHASAHHWAHAGDELNRMRAAMLVAEVHALLGMGPTALALAEEMRDYFAGREETPDWELAFAHAIHAHAAATAGREAEHASSYRVAEQAIEAIAGEQDRDIVQQTFDHVPAPDRHAPVPGE